MLLFFLRRKFRLRVYKRVPWGGLAGRQVFDLGQRNRPSYLLLRNLLNDVDVELADRSVNAGDLHVRWRHWADRPVFFAHLQPDRRSDFGARLPERVGQLFLESNRIDFKITFIRNLYLPNNKKIKKKRIKMKTGIANGWSLAKTGKTGNIAIKQYKIHGKLSFFPLCTRSYRC